MIGKMRRFGGFHTVRRPSEIDPTNLSVETVLEAMIPSESSNPRICTQWDRLVALQMGESRRRLLLVS